jgi:hypothetical protein
MFFFEKKNQKTFPGRFARPKTKRRRHSIDGTAAALELWHWPSLGLQWKKLWGWPR